MASAAFFDIGLVIVVSAAVAVVAHLLRQPPIIAYLLAGLVVGPVMGFIHPGPILETLSTIGIAFLLYLVGLNMNSRVLRDVGKASILAGVGQVLVVTVLGYAIVSFMGFGFLESVYISVALAFSSTVIVVKLLTDVGDIDALYGKLSIGVLLVQDFLAITALILVTGLGMASPVNILMTTVARMSVLFVVAYVSARYILPPFMDYVAQSEEIFFLSGIGWMFVFSGLASLLGLSIEIGAFLAGLSLASLPYTYDLSSRIRPLRDFFIVLFFIVLGARISVASLSSLLVPAAVLSGFVLIINPLVVMVAMGALGYTKRVGFFSGLTLSQISEFSLILMALGLSLGHVSQGGVALVTMVGMVTIAGSVYLLGGGSRLYGILAPYLSVFERENPHEVDEMEGTQYNLVLVGCGRVGQTLLSRLEAPKDEIAILDFNPEIVSQMREKGYDSFYGDISDSDVLEKMEKLNPKLIISTIPDFEDNMVILRKLDDEDTNVFTRAREKIDALDLYNHGADFVLMPHFLGGEMAARLIGDFVEESEETLDDFRENHMEYLKGHEWVGLT